MAVTVRKSPTKRRVRWLLSHVATPLLYAAVATALVASAQSISTEHGISEWERGALSWLLLHRPSRDPDPHLAFVVADTDLFETQQFRDETPDTPKGRPLVSYRPAPVSLRDPEPNASGSTLEVKCECPVPRRCYARAVTRLRRWGAQVVVLDVMLHKPCPLEDDDLSDALDHAGNAVLAAYFNPLPLSSARNLLRTSELQFKQPVFSAVAAVGSPVLDPQSLEYSVELEQTGQDMVSGQLDTLDALAWATVCMAENRMPQETGPWNRFLVDGTQPRLLGGLFSLPAAQAASGPSETGAPGIDLKPIHGPIQIDDVLHRKHLLINYSAGEQENRGRYPMARLSWLLTCSDAEGKARFHDRIVLIGDAASDRHKTVVGEMPGTEALANAVSSILERRPLRAVPVGWVLLLMFGAAALAVSLIRDTPAWVPAPGLPLLALGLLALSQWLIARDWWLLTVSPLATVALASLMILAWQSKTFQAKIGRLAPGPIMALAERAGGFEVEEGSVLFSDIRGYTTISETMHPAEVLTYLNRYMSLVDDILKPYGGQFVTCPGDCVVAWFHDEGRGRSHRERAIRSGLEILANSRRFAEEWKRETGLDFAVGVGINTGPMAVGCLEARRRLEATIIGDAVNTAARIESLTKEYGQFLVSEETIGPVLDRFQAEFVQEVSVKGRSRPVRLYRVSGLADPKTSASTMKGGGPA